jgi:hypothetical protein
MMGPARGFLDRMWLATAASVVTGIFFLTLCYPPGKISIGIKTRMVKDDDKDGYMNILSNIVVPFDPRKTKLLMGSLEYIAAEVVVAKIIRKIIKQDNVGWLHLAYVHAISLPFMGGAAGFFEGTKAYDAVDAKGKKLGFGQQFQDGAKGIPAVLLAAWIVASFTKGFHAPWFQMKDLLITCGTKAITRPVVGFLFEYLPDDAQLNLRVLDQLVEMQRVKSTLYSKPKDG